VALADEEHVRLLAQGLAAHAPHRLGVQGKADVELVSAIGFYSMVAMTLNAFAVSVPGHKEPFA